MSEAPKLRPWMNEIPEKDRQHYSKIGMLSTQDFGESPALIVVDATYGFCGFKGLSLEDSVKDFFSSAGPAAWESVPHIARLIALFRAQDLPIVFTRMDLDDIQFVGGIGKGAPFSNPHPRFNDFPEELAPRKGEWVLDKTKASGFFQTPLTTYLTRRGVRSTVVCGGTTSGCVRATVIDSVSHGFKTFVADEGVFDRSQYAHCANLFDMHGKYAMALSTDDIEAAIRATAPRTAKPASAVA